MRYLGVQEKTWIAQKGKLLFVRIDDLEVSSVSGAHRDSQIEGLGGA